MAANTNRDVSPITWLHYKYLFHFQRLKRNYTRVSASSTWKKCRPSFQLQTVACSVRTGTCVRAANSENMSLNNLLERHSRLFFFFGFTVSDPAKNYSSRDKQLKACGRPAYHFIFVAITVFLTASMWGIGHTLPFNTLSIVLSILLLLGIVLNITVIAEGRLHRHSLPSVHRRFREIDHLFAKHRPGRASAPSFNSVRSKCLKHLIIFMGIFAAQCGCQAIFFEGISLAVVAVPYLILELYAKLIVLHLLFYVALLLHMMQLFNAFITSFDPDADDFNQISISRGMHDSDVALLSKMQLFKLIHHKLWISSKLVTQHFGWTTVVCFTKSFLVLTLAVFHVVVRLEQNMELLGTVREYSVNFEACTPCNPM